MNNVLVFNYIATWTPRDHSRYRIDKILELGIDIIVISPDCSFNASYHINSDDQKLVEDRFSKINKSKVLFLFTNLGMPSLWLLKSVKKNFFQWGFYIKHPIPESTYLPEFISGIKKYIYLLRSIIRSIFYWLFYKLTSQPDIFLFGGSSMKRTIEYKISRRKIPCPSSDFENFLDMSNTFTNKEDKIMVFLDEFGPMHPDQELVRNYSGINPSKSDDYYHHIESSLDVLSEGLKCRTIIAEHPKADYKKYEYFKDFFSIKNKTAQLVGCAEYVTLHKSTAISFAILSNKKIIFIDPSEAADREYRRRVSDLAKFFKCNSFDYRSDKGDLGLYTASKESYEKYKDLFIKPKECSTNESSLIINSLF